MQCAVVKQVAVLEDTVHVEVLTQTDSWNSFHSLLGAGLTHTATTLTTTPTTPTTTPTYTPTTTTTPTS